MKLVRFHAHEGLRVGAIDGDEVVDASRAIELTRPLSALEAAMLHDMVPLIEGGPRALDLVDEAIAVSRRKEGARHKLANVRLLAPLTPGLVLASGGNYKDHRDEKDEAPLAGKEPEYFFKTPRSVIGPEDFIERDPRVTKKLDYEVELAVIMGKRGRHIPHERALDHVFGYTILNDVTARERQVRFRPDGSYFYEAGSSKNFDTSTPMGPYILTADELPDPQSLSLKTYVNQELRQNNSTSNMIFSAAYLVHFFSTFLTLYPGYTIATGTPGGTAWGGDKELGGRPYTRNDVVRAKDYLQVGDVVRCEIERLGVLRNTVTGPMYP
jgi:2-keto-4-pentenoate hydratase/2-oxohepta-3-ene-1,7-dioic acid hydratase in catechol pathway